SIEPLGVSHAKIAISLPLSRQPTEISNRRADLPNRAKTRAEPPQVARWLLVAFDALPADPPTAGDDAGTRAGGRNGRTQNNPGNLGHGRGFALTGTPPGDYKHGSR